jgi:hypothetical protein
MGFDIKAKIEEIVKKVQSDPKMLEKFNSQPTKTVEGLIGADLPEDTIDPIVEGGKAKIAADGIKGAISGIGGLFGKKSED